MLCPHTLSFLTGLEPWSILTLHCCRWQQASKWSIHLLCASIKEFIVICFKTRAYIRDSSLFVDEGQEWGGGSGPVVQNFISCHPTGQFWQVGRAMNLTNIWCHDALKEIFSPKKPHSYSAPLWVFVLGIWITSKYLTQRVDFRKEDARAVSMEMT